MIYRRFGRQHQNNNNNNADTSHGLNSNSIMNHTRKKEFNQKMQRDEDKALIFFDSNFMTNNTSN
jgi:hypothetical protein